MYSFIWRKLPGPKWLKFIEVLILLFAIIWVLFNYGFPWASEHIGWIDSTLNRS